MEQGKDLESSDRVSLGVIPTKASGLAARQAGIQSTSKKENFDRINRIYRIREGEKD